MHKWSKTGLSFRPIRQAGNAVFNGTLGLWGSASGLFDEPMPLILRNRKFAGIIAF
jgi:hypothetical protein